MATSSNPSRLPDGGFYLWTEVPGGNAWACTEWLAAHGGMIVSPGEFYGEAGKNYVRSALVEPDERLALVAERLKESGARWTVAAGYDLVGPA